MYICVYGSASDTIDSALLKEAYRLGQVIGGGNHTLLFGAGNTGVMGACARGVRDTGGKIIGVAPLFFNTPGILFPHCTELILTETMRERKAILEEKSQLFVAAPGGIGTLDEFFEIFTLYTLGQHNKPVCLLNTNGCWDELLALLDNMVDNKYLRKEYRDMLIILDDPEQLADIIQ